MRKRKKSGRVNPLLLKVWGNSGVGGTFRLSPDAYADFCKWAVKATIIAFASFDAAINHAQEHVRAIAERNLTFRSRYVTAAAPPKLGTAMARSCVTGEDWA